LCKVAKISDTTQIVQTVKEKLINVKIKLKSKFKSLWAPLKINGQTQRDTGWMIKNMVKRN
jgi:hypothetical protein